MFLANVIDEKTRWRLQTIETFEARRLGSMTRARASVAAAIGLSESSLDRVRRGRVKAVKAFVAEAVCAAFVEVLSREMTRLQDELALAGGRPLAADEEGEARAAGAAARRHIEGRPR